MEKVSKQALLYVADLTIPSAQVIVVNGNIGCSFCRRRVSQVISKMSGLKEYTVDVGNKQVIAKGDVKLYAANRRRRWFLNKRKKKTSNKQHLLIKLLLGNRLVTSLLNQDHL